MQMGLLSHLFLKHFSHILQYKFILWESLLWNYIALDLWLGYGSMMWSHFFDKASSQALGDPWF